MRDKFQSFILLDISHIFIKHQRKGLIFRVFECSSEIIVTDL